jgi:hypothetical protein
VSPESGIRIPGFSFEPIADQTDYWTLPMVGGRHETSIPKSGDWLSTVGNEIKVTTIALEFLVYLSFECTGESDDYPQGCGVNTSPLEDFQPQASDSEVQNTRFERKSGSGKEIRTREYGRGDGGPRNRLVLWWQ